MCVFLERLQLREESLGAVYCPTAISCTTHHSRNDISTYLSKKTSISNHYDNCGNHYDACLWARRKILMKHKFYNEGILAIAVSKSNKLTVWKLFTLVSTILVSTTPSLQWTHFTTRNMTIIIHQCSRQDLHIWSLQSFDVSALTSSTWNICYENQLIPVYIIEMYDFCRLWTALKWFTPRNLFMMLWKNYEQWK